MKFGHKFADIIEATHPSVSDQVRVVLFIFLFLARRRRRGILPSPIPFGAASTPRTLRKRETQSPRTENQARAGANRTPRPPHPRASFAPCFG